MSLSDNDIVDFDRISRDVKRFNYYPRIDDGSFYQKIFNKAEFSYGHVWARPAPIISGPSGELVVPKRFHQIQPHQLFVKNFLNPNTPYNGLLLFYGTGSGKTCASLLIAEQLRPLVEASGGKIIILGKSKSHIESIFTKEMYDINKELQEIDQNLPKGSLHCLGNTYFGSDNVMMMDENSFFVSAKKVKKKIKRFYEFYGFTEFHLKVNHIQTKHQEFLEDYFENCIFIVDEAHNLSGLMEPRDRGDVKEADDDEEDEETGEAAIEDLEDREKRRQDMLLEAERLRLRMIRSKRNVQLNIIKMQELLSNLSFMGESSTGEIFKLRDENAFLRETIHALRSTMIRKMYDLMELDFRPADLKSYVPLKDLPLHDAFVPALKSRLKDAIAGAIPKDVKGDPRRMVDDNEILDFLIRFDGNSCLKNVFKTFLKVPKQREDTEGLKAYHALKNVLLSIGQSKIILLSATPMRDKEISIVNLLNILRINDGHKELRIGDLFQKRGPRVEEIRTVAKGYVSYYRGNDPEIFPEVIWNLRHHPNENDSQMINPDDLIEFSLNPQLERSPSVHLIKCWTEASVQNLEYRRYLMYHNKISRERTEDQFKLESKKRTQLEYRCNFALEIKREDIEVFMNAQIDEHIKTCVKRTKKGDYVGCHASGTLDARCQRRFALEFVLDETDGAEYLVNYSHTTFFNYLFRQDQGRFSYRHPEKHGDFLALGKVGDYSKKIKSLIDNVVNERNRGINLIYSKYAYMGCYLIALALEKMGYRRYQEQSIWRDSSEHPKLCSKCNKTQRDHDDSHQFKQAHYIIAVGSSDEVHHYMDVLTHQDNLYGEDIKVVIGTSTITEGLDFKYVRYVHVLEPWYNFTRLDQLAGRGSRQYSHRLFRDASHKNVAMFLYAYFLPETNLNVEPGSEGDAGTVDADPCYSTRYTEENHLTKDLENYRMTLEKDCRIKKVESIIKSVAVDCPLHLELNYHRRNDIDFSRECHYRTCGEFKCSYTPDTVLLTGSDSGGYSYNGRPIDEGVTLGEILGDRLDPERHVVVGYHSRRPYAIDGSLLLQVREYGDLKPGVGARPVLWVIDQKDMSTFYPYFAHVMAAQLVPLMKFAVTSNFSLDRPVFSLKQITDIVDRHISFTVPPEYKRALYYYVLSLMSGTMVRKNMGFSDFVLIPMQLPDDIYYVIHPNYIENTETSTYYKHIWPKKLRKQLEYVDLSKWNVESKQPESFVEELPEYIGHINNNGYNIYELFSEFSKKDDDALVALMQNLISHVFDKNRQYQTRLVDYLAHFLEYKSLTRITRCQCDSYTHPPDASSGDGHDLVFLFQYHHSDVVEVRLNHGQPVVYESTQFSNLSILKEERKESKIALGYYDFLKSKNRNVFKLKNNLKAEILISRGKESAKEQDESKKPKKIINKRDLPRGMNCTTFSFKRETQDDPGIISIYGEVVARAAALGLTCKHQPPFYVIDQMGGGKIVFLFNNKIIDKREKDLIVMLCSSLELYLHFLHHHDPEFHYFKYAGRGSGATPKSTVTPVSEKRRGRRKGGKTT